MTYIAPAPAMDPKEKEAIRSVLKGFLKTMGLKFRAIPYNKDFAEAACEDGIEHYGLRREDAKAPDFQLALHGAVSIAVATYGHLPDIRTQYWIALYTTCLIFFDDLSVTDPEAVREFHPRFICGEPQKHRLLDMYASLLRKARERWSGSAANLVVSSSLDFIEGLIVDYDLKKMQVHESALSYPRYVRTMMGVSTAFVVFTFPRHILLDQYIQILPNMVNYIDDVNDVFSFYKEQLANEDTNHIALLSKLHGWTKLEALQYLVDFSIQGAQRSKQVLTVHPEAYDIYCNKFLQGYVDFHAAATKRYKLDDLELEDD